MNKHNFKKYTILFLIIFLIFNFVYFISDSYQKKEEITTTITNLNTAWHEKDFDTLKDISKNDSRIYQFQTGFENNKIIKEELDKHIYENTEIKINKISSKYHNKKTTGKAKVVVTTYNNLEVLDICIKTLVNQENQINYNYNHKDWIQKNSNLLKDKMTKIEKSYSKIVLVNLVYNSELNKWEIPFENNYDFYNILSGNMIELNQKLKSI